MAMRHLFFAFPGGAAGIALVLFRLSSALWIVEASGVGRSVLWPAALPSIAAAGLAAGFGTRVVAAIGATVPLVVAATTGRYPALAEVSFVLIAAGVTLIGPGAYSIDAALFGRRTVHLPD